MKIHFDIITCDNSFPNLLENHRSFVYTQIIKNNHSGHYICCKQTKINFENILKLSEKDDYNSHQEKYIKALKYNIETSINFDWYVLADDDTYICISNLEKYLSTQSNKNLEIHGLTYFAEIERAQEIGVSIKALHCHGGCGIIMNKNTFYALTKFIDFNNIRYHWKYGDVMLGRYVYYYNLENPETQICFNQPPKGVYGGPHGYVEYCSVHKTYDFCHVSTEKIKSLKDIITMHNKNLKIKFEDLYKINN